MAQGLGWQRSIDLLVQGDWIIRVTVRQGTVTPTPDMEPSMMPDMMPDMMPEMAPDATPDVAPSALVLTAINPTQGINDKDTDVTILGSGFTQTTTFRVGSTQLTNLLIQSDSAALAVVPSGIVPGTYDVMANDQASGVQSILNSGFTVVAPPVAAPPADDGCSTVAGFNSTWIPLCLFAFVWVVFRRRR